LGAAGNRYRGWYKATRLIGICCTHIIKNNCLVIGNKDKAVNKIYEACKMG